MRPIKVLQVCTVPSTAKVFISPFARYLTDKGYRVTISCSGNGSDSSGSLVAYLRDQGFRLKIIPMHRELSPLADAISIGRLYRFIRTEGFDIVHTQTSKAGFIGRTAAWLARAPVIMHTAHAFPFHPYLQPGVRKLYVYLERLAAAFADLIIVDTDAVRQDGILHHIAGPAKITTVNMGIDLARFDPDLWSGQSLRGEFSLGPSAPLIVCVARLVPDKGLECLLEAVALVVGSRPECKFLIAGDGPLRTKLMDEAVELGIEDSVIFAGFRNDVPRVLAAADLFVLPTLREGFGVVFAEAMAMGVPVVGSKMAPITEVVKDGETGILVPPNQPRLFAEAIVSLLEDEAKRRDMAQAARARVQALFDERSNFERMESLYQDLLRQKGLCRDEN
ncbi:MAG TPA: glycosyltransferase family 4 protein [Anaerolineae bacterium]|nr:glycosyltransferase family 4 protein [Anaerolineae bacterium]